MTCRKQYWVGGYRSLDGRCASCGARLRAGDAMVTVTSKDVPDDASVRDEEVGHYLCWKCGQECGQEIQLRQPAVPSKLLPSEEAAGAKRA